MHPGQANRAARYLFSPFREKVGLLLALSLMAWQHGLAQNAPDSVFRKIITLPYSVITAAADPLGQMYLVTGGQEIVKLSPQGEELFRNSNRRLGAMGRVVATDPLNVLVTFPDFNRLILFDRTLSPQSELFLPGIGIFQASAVGFSADNQLWIYDELNHRLKKIDRAGQILFEGANLAQLLGVALRPTSIAEAANRVYMSEPQAGILVFDSFGQYLLTLPFTKVDQVEPAGERLFFLHDRQLCWYGLQDLRTQCLPLPTELQLCARVWLSGRFIFATVDGSTRVYQF